VHCAVGFMPETRRFLSLIRRKRGHRSCSRRTTTRTRNNLPRSSTRAGSHRAASSSPRGKGLVRSLDRRWACGREHRGDLATGVVAAASFLATSWEESASPRPPHGPEWGGQATSRRRCECARTQGPGDAYGRDFQLGILRTGASAGCRRASP
jgi:hypothetical protein